MRACIKEIGGEGLEIETTVWTSVGSPRVIDEAGTGYEHQQPQGTVRLEDHTGVCAERWPSWYLGHGPIERERVRSRRPSSKVSSYSYKLTISASHSVLFENLK